MSHFTLGNLNPPVKPPAKPPVNNDQRVSSVPFGSSGLTHSLTWSLAYRSRQTFLHLVMAKDTANTRRLRIACDRCYDLKERCVRECVTATCVRCERLRLHCSTDRPVRPSGRRPQHGKRTVSQRSSTLLNKSEPASNDVSTKLQYERPCSWIRPCRETSYLVTCILMLLTPACLAHYSARFEASKVYSFSSPSIFEILMKS